MNQSCSGTVEEIGQSTVFLKERLGFGRFGSAFAGKLKHVAEEVAIKKMIKGNIQIDSSLYVKTIGQPNVIGYYGTEHSTDDQFM